MSNASARHSGVRKRGVAKAAVVGAMKQVAAKVAEGACAASPEASVVDHAAQGATVSSAYEGLSPDRCITKRALSEYVKCDTLTDWRESLWSMLKHSHKGTTHNHLSRHRNRQVPEFASRHSLRDEDAISFLGTVAIGIHAEELQYRELFADNGLRNGPWG